MQEKIDELWEAYEACLSGISKLQDTLECSERAQRRVLLQQNDLQSHEVRSCELTQDPCLTTHDG